jgi:arylsulfatase A-like enzyme
MKLITLFISLGSLLASIPAQAEKPNVLFIAVDDLNDWAGYRGHKQVLTPNMDKLASQGVAFTEAYCQYPLCGPSRASVMSSLYYHDFGFEKLQSKDSEVEKMAEKIGAGLMHGYFKKHGYKTLAVGKILHRHLPTKNLDESGGRGSWDFNYDKKGKKVKSNFFSNKTLTDWDYFKKPEAEMSDYKTAKWAAERLKKKHDKPFFLMAGFLRPHVPWYVPKKYFDLYDKEKIKLPIYKEDDLDDISEAGKETINKGYPRTEWAQKEKQWKNIVHSYLASITFVDTQIGKVLDALAESPYAENTIVVLWSDHGYHMGEKNTFQKHTLWERSAAVPLIIKAPKMQTNAQCARTVQLVDIFPTLVELCDLPASDKLKGKSLMPLLQDPTKEWNYPAFTYIKGGGKSVQQAKWRFIEYGDGSQELYDHSTDPHEWTNLAKDPKHKDRLQKMQSWLKENR